MKTLILSLALIGTLMLSGCKKSTAPEPEKVPVFKFNFDTVSLSVGGYKSLNATSITGDYDFADLHFESTNASILKVSYTEVVALAEGTAEVKAMKGTTEVGRFKVIVKNILISGVSIADATLFETQTVSVTAKFTPENATFRTFSWSSADPGIAIVSGTGYFASVVGIRAGTTTITATTPEGIKGTCKITVTALPPYPKAGVDAVVKSLNENVLPTLNQQADFIMSSFKGNNQYWIASKGVTAYDWVGESVLSKWFYAESFLDYPLPTTPIGSFFYLFSKHSESTPTVGGGLAFRLDFYSDRFELTEAQFKSTPNQVYRYDQVQEFTKYLLEYIQKKVDAIKKANPTYFP